MRAAAVALAMTMASAAQAQDAAREPGDAQAAAKAFIAATSAGRPARRDPPLRSASSAPSLGVACAISPAGAQVIAIMPRSPAEAAGLKPGAFITSVNGASLAGLSPEAVAAALKPPTMRVVYGLAGGAAITLTRTAPPEAPVALGSAAD